LFKHSSLRILIFVAFLVPLFAGEPSDPKALEIADKVMAALGGQENYDQTRFITWRFFGRRLHVWDKHTGMDRFENGKGLTVILNVNTKVGKAWENGAAIEDEARLAEVLQKGYEAWINDSYWLVMPYKLKDPGVTLRYTREDQTADGRPAEVLTMTFDSVGVTPENKYEIFVDKETNLVTQWNFFSKADDAEPRFTTPWGHWEKHGSIMLSADRGEGQHTDVAVLEQLPDGVYENPDPIDLVP